MTGVSKGMLAQIEKGSSSPTITTLWKIANGPQVSFTSLAEKPAGEPTVVRKHEKTPVMAGEEKYAAFPHFPFDQKKKFEIFYIELAPGCVHESEPHHGGIEEYVLVSRGAIAVTACDYTCGPERRRCDAFHRKHRAYVRKQHGTNGIMLYTHLLSVKRCQDGKARFTQLSRRASFRGFPCRRLHSGRFDIRAFGENNGAVAF
nr:helix-turn-helix domain-containing protein [Bacillus licheniformis]